MLSPLEASPEEGLQRRFGMSVPQGFTALTSRTLSVFSRVPLQLVLSARVRTLGFKDMGTSLEYYPNHGLFSKGSIVLNTRLVEDPQVFRDRSGRTLDRFDHTLLHELGHGVDEEAGMLSMQPDWLRLSGWSGTPYPGAMRVTIQDEGGNSKKGEWFFSPSAKFTRFYAQTNPWDDWADSFAFFVAGLGGFLSTPKVLYFNSALGHYWG